MSFSTQKAPPAEDKGVTLEAGLSTDNDDGQGNPEDLPQGRGCRGGKD